MSIKDMPRALGRRHFWLTLGAVVGTCLSVLPWVTSFGPLNGDRPALLATFLVTVVPGVLLFAAWRRSEPLSRLRQALALLAFSILLTAGGNLLRLLHALGLALPEIPGLDITSTFVIWALGLAALLRLPLAPPSRGGWWRIAADITIAAVGLGLAVFVIWTLPGLRLAPPGLRSRIMLYNWMEAANLGVLSLILVRGPLRPIRRAVWWLAATIVIETTYLIALQYAIGRQAHDLRLANSLFFVDYLAYLFTAAFFLSDPQAETRTPLLPEGLRAVNPLPILAVFGVGGLLIFSTSGNPDRGLLPLAIGIVFMALLLLARLIGTTLANLRILRDEAAEDARRHSEKLETMGRMAGGIAHVLNNLMNGLQLQADLVLLRAGQDEPVRDNLKKIGVEIRRAETLAVRLLQASGRRSGDHRRSRLAEVVRLQRESVSGAVGRGTEVSWELAEAQGGALVDPSELEVVLRELVSNAADATPAGGMITIRVRDEVLSNPPPGMSPCPLPGRYSVLEVADAGRGIEPADLPRIFEPFFSTRPTREGRGLGLSVVHGIVASYGGGVLVQTVQGAGTRISVYLPTTSLSDTPVLPSLPLR